MPVALFEAALFLFVLLVGVTQILWPIVRGTPLFPMFRREAVLHRELEMENQRQIERALAHEVQRRKLGITNDDEVSQK